MKKSIFILGMLITGSLFITSCNKNLKDDIKDLKQQVSDMENSLGSNEPITVTSTFKDNDGKTRTITETYKFKANNNTTQKLVKKADGSYLIYIERFSDVEWWEGAWVEFIYNPDTKTITNKRGGHYWDDEDPFVDVIRYDENAYKTGLTFNIMVDKLDVNTGDIAVKVEASSTSAFLPLSNQGRVPNPGQPASTSFSFTGKLKVFTTN